MANMKIGFIRKKEVMTGFRCIEYAIFIAQIHVLAFETCFKLLPVSFMYLEYEFRFEFFVFKSHMNSIKSHFRSPVILIQANLMLNFFPKKKENS